MGNNVRDSNVGPEMSLWHCSQGETMVRIEPRKIVWVVLLVFLGGGVWWSNAASARSPISDAAMNAARAGLDGGDAYELGNLLSDVQVPQHTSKTFTDLYSKHKAEIDRILNDNPYLIWESIDVVLDALPALKSVPQNGGRLYIDKRLYSKATDLLSEIEALSSPELSHDLQQSWAFVQNRAKDSGQGAFVIDLN